MARKLLARLPAPAAAFNFDRGAPTPESFRFAADAPATIAAGKEGAARRFEGVAYSGDKITGHWYWGDVVFDLSSTRAPQKLPMLVGHDNEKIAGFSDKVVIGKQIDIAGALSSKTQFGQDVAALSDEGFPWQMSVRIEPAEVDEIKAGKSIDVNGRTFTGPITVFRHSVIREVSFTPTGWDAQTSATAMARGNQSTREDSLMTPEEITALQAKAAQFEKQAQDERAAREKAAADLAAEQAKVAAFEKADRDRKTAERTEAVKKLFADTGVKHTDELGKPYMDMDEATFSAVAAQLRDTAKKRASDDPALFSETATAGTVNMSDPQAIADAATALVHKFEKEGRTLLIEDAVRMVTRKAAA